MLEVFGAIFITLAGAAGHFVYEWSRHDPVVAVFFSVNESVWEHIKLAVLPSFIWFIICARFYSGNPNLVPAQAASLLTTIVLIPALFYGYTRFTRKSILICNIVCFAIGAFAGMHVFNRIINAAAPDEPFCTALYTLCLLVLIAVALAFLNFSYHPLHNFLFVDPVTGEYGIPGHRCSNPDTGTVPATVVPDGNTIPAAEESAANMEFLSKANKVYFVAMKEELDSSMTHTPVVYSGVGKARATRSLISYLNTHRARFASPNAPIIVSIGTAGSGKHRKGDFILVDNFDNIGDSFINETISFDIFPEPTGHVCASSDFFIGPANFTQEEIAAMRSKYDCMDMESFALANICNQFGIKFCAVKCISDGADGLVSNFDEELPKFREKINAFVKKLDSFSES